MTTKEIREKIETIVNPTNGKTLKELKSIKHIGINDEKDLVILLIQINKKGSEEEIILKRELAKVIKIDLGFSGIKIQFEENKQVSNIAGSKTEFIMISSGKGGVGKSTLTINLAYALKDLGKKVGIIDADIYCASIAKMLVMEDASPMVDTMNKIIPFKKDDLEVISTDFFSEKESPLLWRGSMLTSMINNFLYQVSWRKDLDYLLIDCPSGTGDALLDLGNFLPNAKVLLVSESDMISSINTLKTAKGHQQMKQEIIGIVINKYIDNDYASMYLNNKLNIEILATIPYEKNNGSYIYTGKAKEACIDLATLISINNK